jgi:hypothetical protein
MDGNIKKINHFSIEENIARNSDYLYTTSYAIIQWESSVRILDIIPAKESSENPIIIKEDSYFFK